MHGRPREWKNKTKDPKVAAAHKKKVDAIRDATTAVLAVCKANRFDEAAMGAAAKLLSIVPEIYTVWNYRRRALQSVLEAGGAAAQKAAQGELALTQQCLMENPKSYSTWHHRRWIIGKVQVNLAAELALVTKALTQESRNFHAWGYRVFIVKAMGRDAAEELEYTEEKIIDDFSNYSAWHYRTVMLTKVHGGEGGSGDEDGTTQSQLLPTEVLDEEYDMVHQAFATDTKDQSPWMYYRWLMGSSIAHLQAAKGTPDYPQASAVLTSVLEREIGRFEEDHLVAEPDAKWPLLTVARLKEAQVQLGLGEINPEEVASIYKRLMVLDPLRKGFYQDALDGKAKVVVFDPSN